MTLKGHIATLLYATWRFLFDGDEALKLITPSGRGVLQSFIALAFAFPVFSLIIWLQFQSGGPEWFGPFHILGLFVGYVLAAAGYAFLIFHAWAVVGHRHDYLYFMPLYNWGRVFSLLILTPYFVLESLGVLEGVVKDGAMIFSLSLMLVWKLSIVRKALGANLFHGIIFVLFDVLIVLIVDVLILDLYRVFQ